MGTDYFALECVRGPALPDVAKTITKMLARKGWVADASGSGRARSVLLSQEAAWVVIDDADFASATWAGPLSKALGGVGITLRIGSDSASFALQRFDDGELVGDLSEDASTRKHVRRVEGQRIIIAEDAADLGRKRHLGTAFLADLGAPTSRPKLRRGFRVDGHGFEACLLDIAKLAGLPEPRDRYAAPEGELQLSFRRAPPAGVEAGFKKTKGKAKQPSRIERRSGHANISMGKAFHLCGVDREKLLDAIDVVLASDRFARTLFVSNHGRWESFGEGLDAPGPQGSRCLATPELDDRIPEIAWGAALSAKLGESVLAVEDSTFRVWTGGRMNGELRIASLSRGSVHDVSVLAPFVPASRAHALSSFELTETQPWRIAYDLAESLGLGAPGIFGRRKGVLVTSSADETAARPRR